VREMHITRTALCSGGGGRGKHPGRVLNQEREGRGTLYVSLMLRQSVRSDKVASGANVWPCVSEGSLPIGWVR